MFLWILIFVIMVVMGVGFGLSYKVHKDIPDEWFLTLVPSGFAMIICLFVSLPITETWLSHAEDLSKIRAQQPVIEVYEERRDTLATVLENFNYPTREGITLNADSPVASVVEQLSEVESKLANVKAEVALARRSIEARRAGPMGGIVTLMGDE